MSYFRNYSATEVVARIQLFFSACIIGAYFGGPYTAGRGTYAASVHIFVACASLVSAYVLDLSARGDEDGA